MTERDEQQIEQMVDSFYEEAMNDSVLGPVFQDVAHFDLAAHAPTMYAFWKTLLFDTHEYRGSAFKPHLAINAQYPLGEEHFARWLVLFGEAADRHLDRETAERAKTKARNIAWVMASKLNRMAPAS